MRGYAICFVLAMLLAALPAAAQEPSLEGRRVTVLLDMPGDESGIDIDARGATPVDNSVVSGRVDKYGVALKRGRVATVTLMKVKGDHIEVQLDGGGFTDRQLFGLPSIDSVHWGMSDEEKRLKYDISGTRDVKRRRQLESRYDSLRMRRVKPLRKQLELERRREHGSRFNLRFASAREASQATPAELTRLLRPYLEFDGKN